MTRQNDRMTETHFDIMTTNALRAAAVTTDKLKFKALFMFKQTFRSREIFFVVGHLCRVDFVDSIFEHVDLFKIHIAEQLGLMVLKRNH